MHSRLYTSFVEKAAAKSSNQPSQTNAERSYETRSALVAAALESLVAIGYARTTGVEVCRRADLTRGALNHHFPDFGHLLASALGAAYERLLVPVELPEELGPLESRVHQAQDRIAQPEFKAVVELWLASQNDPNLGEMLAEAMAQGAGLFEPQSMLDQPAQDMSAETQRVFWTISETFIGLGVGIATNGGRRLAHHDAVVELMLELARSSDQRTQSLP